MRRDRKAAAHTSKIIVGVVRGSMFLVNKTLGRRRLSVAARGLDVSDVFASRWGGVLRLPMLCLDLFIIILIKPV